VETMRNEGFAFGGEQSGHLILLDYASTGDGCVAALRLLEVMVRAGKPLSELKRTFTRMPQHLVNVKVVRKPPLEELEGATKVIRMVESALGADGRVLVRYSGTEHKLRVMVEGPDADKTKQ